MDAKWRIYAYPVAAVGAGVLVASLWLPWYRFHVSGPAARQVVQLGGGSATQDPFISFVRGGGSLHFSGWQLIGSSRMIIVLAGAIVIALALAALLGAARRVAGKAIALFAFVGLITAGERMVFRPGPDVVLSLEWGAYLGLGGAAVALVAGRIAQAPGAGRRPPSRPPANPPRRSTRRRYPTPRTSRHLRPVQ